MENKQKGVGKERFAKQNGSFFLVTRFGERLPDFPDSFLGFSRFFPPSFSFKPDGFGMKRDVAGRTETA